MNEWDKSIKYASIAKICVEIKGKRRDSCELNGEYENKEPSLDAWCQIDAFI